MTPLKITRLNLHFDYFPAPAREAELDTLSNLPMFGERVVIRYGAIGIDSTGAEHAVPHGGEKEIYIPELQDHSLVRKLHRIGEALMQTVAERLPPIDVGGQLVLPRPTLHWYSVAPDLEVGVRYWPIPAAGHVASSTWMELRTDQLTEATRRLIENVIPSMEQLAWSDFHECLGTVPPLDQAQRKVLISYRSGREQFAEAIAHRLGREGFLPWFDKWDVLAGDSVPREVANAFADVYAVVFVLTADYPGIKWAREELETAIVKRVEQGVRVIPMLYEQCEIPELLRPLRYIDCRLHDESAIEIQYRELIDALNEVELNPYR